MLFPDLFSGGRVNRTLPLVSVVITALGIAFNGQACGPDFPVRLLAARNNTLLSMPEGNFAFEANRLLPVDKQLPQWKGTNVDTETTEQAEPLSAEQRIIAQMRDSKNVEAAKTINAPELSKAARLYTLGAIAFAAKDPLAADYFRQVLALADNEQKAWGLKAQYSLGRVLMGDFSVNQYEVQDDIIHPDRAQLEQALHAFQQVIDRVKGGADDPEQLALGSLGQQARIHLWLGEIVPAVRLYAQQAAQGDDSGGLSLQYISSYLTDPQHQQELKQTIDDPVVQQLVTIELFTRSGNLQADASEESGDSKKAIVDPILTLLNHSVQRGFEGSDRLAAFAYRSGQYAMADSLLKQAGDGGLAWWLRAKMALRNGNVEAAANAYSKAAAAFPPDESWGVQRDEDYASEWISPDCRISAERAILSLNHNDYRQAMELMYRGREEYWTDVADIAERVLTLDELKTFVDRQVPAPETPLKPRKPGEYPGGQKITHDILMRDLLARRLMRAGRYKQAINYFDIPENRKDAQDYSALLTVANDKTKSRTDRAKAYYQAAMLMRKSGLEITGYEMTPDYAIYGASYSNIEDVFANPHRNKKWTGADETARAARSLPAKHNHFLHYRWQAVGLAEKAADLLPKKSQSLSAVLCNAASWVIARDERTGRALYQRYIREGAHYKEGDQFGYQCQVPDFLTGQ